MALLEHTHVGSRPYDSQSSNEISAHDPRDTKITARTIDSDRCSRCEHATKWREREHSVRPKVEVHVVAIAKEGSSRLAIVDRLELQLGWKEKRVFLGELIRSAVYHELEIVSLALDRVESQSARQYRPQNLFVVFHQGRRLQRIADHERIGRKASVGFPPQIDEVWREGKNHPEAHACVVIVGETALGERLRGVCLDAQIDSFPKILIEVCPNALLPIASVVDDPAIVLPNARGKIPRVGITTTHIHDAFARNRSTPSELPLMIKGDALLIKVGRGRAPRGDCVGKGIEGPRAKRIGNFGKPDPLRRVNLSLARSAATGGDDHHSVRCP